MQELSDIVQAMTSPEALQKAQRLGLTTTAGRTNQLQSSRSQPLTESQITRIASDVLRQPLSITLEEKKIYGRKKVYDDGNEVYVDECVIDSKIEIDCVVYFKLEMKKEMLLATLETSPKEACVRHLAHLMLHKKFGSGDHDRAILMNDYVRALHGIPEFVLYQILKFYWESDKRPFVPFIAEIKEACRIFENSLRDQYDKIINPQPKAIKREAPKPVELEPIDPIAEAERMLALAKANPQFLDATFWEKELEKLKNA